jgi:hypothetical protein
MTITTTADRSAANQHFQTLFTAQNRPASATIALRQDPQGDIEGASMTLAANLLATVELAPRSFGAAFILVINPGTLNSETDQWTIGPSPTGTIAEIPDGQTLGTLVYDKIAQYHDRV